MPIPHPSLCSPLSSVHSVPHLYAFPQMLSILTASHSNPHKISNVEHNPASSSPLTPHHETASRSSSPNPPAPCAATQSAIHPACTRLDTAANNLPQKTAAPRPLRSLARAPPYPPKNPRTAAASNSPGENSKKT